MWSKLHHFFFLEFYVKAVFVLPMGRKTLLSFFPLSSVVIFFQFCILVYFTETSV